METDYFFLTALSIPSPMIIYPTVITPIKKLEMEASPPSATNDTLNTDVPINAPPTIRRRVVSAPFFTSSPSSGNTIYENCLITILLYL